MAEQILLVNEDAVVLRDPSTKVIAKYPSGEVLVRTQAPQIETARPSQPPSFGLVIDGFDESALRKAEQAPRTESTEPFLAYVVLAGPTQPEWLERLRAAGVEPLRFQPRSAYLAKATGTAFDRAKELDFVVQVVTQTTDLKRAPAMRETGSTKVWIVIDASADVQRIVNRLSSIAGVKIEGNPTTAAGMSRLPAVIEGGALQEALAIPFVLGIEDRLPVRPEDEVAGLILAGSYDHQKRPTGLYLDWLQAHGLSGQGVTIGIVDDGVDETHEAFTGRITTRDNGRAWHGTFVAGHAAGRYLTERDPNGFVYGLGTAPSAELISQDNSDAAADACRETVTTAGPGGAQGTIQNNSWGVGTTNPMDYRSLEASYDALVRNSTPGDATSRPLTVCFSAGNEGVNGLTRPKAAKNLIVTGNSEVYRPTVGGSESDNIDHLYTGAHGSSHGNCGDGRIRPHVVAPGEWTASANFDSRPGQVEFISAKLTWGGGTSGASPKTAGACALLTQWWRSHNAGKTPSPALLRALVVNGAEDMGFGGPIPNSRQGWGRLNLANVISEQTHHTYVDQSSMLRNRGEMRTWRLRVADADMPVRVTLAWTDPPGPLNSGTATTPAIVNSLALAVHTAGQVYHGNRFVNGLSVAGPLPNPDQAGRDNLQNVYLPAGAAQSPFTVEIKALNITTNCLTGTATQPQQDFALVVTNGYVDAGSVPSDLFMVVDDTSPGAGSSVDDVVVGGGGTDDPTLSTRPNLQRGDRGDNVRDLQTMLQQTGHLPGGIDGVFGFSTQAAVKSFQRSAGLNQDGVVGPATWAALEAATGGRPGSSTPGGGTSPGGGTTPGGGATPGGGTTPGTSRPTVRLGDRGDDVRFLQERLSARGFLNGTIDGVFGTGTLRAVQSFQRSAGLTDDGVVGPSTWGALESSTSGGGSSGGGTTGGGTTPGGGTTGGGTPSTTRPTVRLGDRGDHVRFLQERLSARGFLSGTIDGVFGTGTLRAVQSFQRSAGLTDDGVVGPSTWGALESSTSGGGSSGGGTTPGGGAGSGGGTSTGGGTTGGGTTGGGTSPSTTRPTVRVGDRGEDVRFLQQQLSQRGLLSGPVDGIFGNGTMRAVQAFQRSRGLTADGVVGPATWAALSNEAARDGATGAPLTETGPRERDTGSLAALAAAAERGLRAAPEDAQLSADAASEAGGSRPHPSLSEALAKLMARFDEWVADGRRKAALIVVGGQTRVAESDISALRRLAMHGDLYLVGTDATVLRAIAQALHLRRGVHIRTATPENLDVVVRSVAAEAAGSQELILRQSTENGQLRIGFDLTRDDTKAVLEVEGAAASEMDVVLPGNVSHRMTANSDHEGNSLRAEGNRLTLELHRNEARPWAGAWEVRVGTLPGANVSASGFAGPGPVIRIVERSGPESEASDRPADSMLSAMAENGAGIEKLWVEASPTGSPVASESAPRPVEIVAKPRRISAEGAQTEAGESAAAAPSLDAISAPPPSLDVILRLPEAGVEPGLTEVRVTVEGRTATGYRFARLLRYTLVRLVPRPTWRRRLRTAVEIFEAAVVNVVRNVSGEISELTLRDRDGRLRLVKVDDPSIRATLDTAGTQRQPQHFVLEGERVVRVIRILAADGNSEVVQ
jgi:peptidoglycan hydrolase-like protein with peptidoglycan-binding domain